MLAQTFPPYKDLVILALADPSTAGGATTQRLQVPSPPGHPEAMSISA